MEIQLYTLSNGLRLVHQYSDSVVSHFGLIINTGSRDEAESEQGLAHFIEHMVFKGTRRRKVYHVLSRMEHVGGDLNAYTGREETSIYASFLGRYYPRTMELLSDIVFNSVFPEKEIEKERDVVIDEIHSYIDTPSERIIDDFEEMLFPGHPLGRNILGTVGSVKGFQRKHILDFISRNYTTDQIVLSSVGKIGFKRLVYLAEKFFGSIPSSVRRFEREKNTVYEVFHSKNREAVTQVHCVLGNLAPSVYSDDRVAMALLTNILGGPGLNSRLNLAVREKNGLSYQIEAHYQPFTDNGIFSVYLSTEISQLHKAYSLVWNEMERFKNNKLGVLQLNQAKKQILGQLAIASESNLATMLANGKQVTLSLPVESFESIVNKVNNITAQDILRVANEYLNRDKFSSLIFEPQQI